MIDAILHYSFMRNALFAALLASIVSGIIGTIAIEKKLVSMSGGIAHASFGGIGLGYLLGFEPIWGGLLFAVGASCAVCKLSEQNRVKADTMIGILWSFGMALGILFITLAPGYMPDMTSYLFGDILTVSKHSLLAMAGFTLIVGFVFAVFYHHLVLYLFDEEYAHARGMRVHLMEWIVYLMIPVGIIVLVKVVGIILTIALLTMPVSIAKMLFRSIGKVIVSAMAVSFIFCLAGLTLAYYLNIPSGVSIVIISAITYFLMAALRDRVRKWRHKRMKHAAEPSA